MCQFVFSPRDGVDEDGAENLQLIFYVADERETTRPIRPSHLQFLGNHSAVSSNDMIMGPLYTAESDLRPIRMARPSASSTVSIQDAPTWIGVEKQIGALNMAMCILLNNRVAILYALEPRRLSTYEKPGPSSNC